MKIKTSELTGPALDWAVAKCEGILQPIHGETSARVVLYVDQWQTYMRLNPPPQVYYTDRYEPSANWSQGGPIIERERIELKNWGIDGWNAHATDYAFRPGNDEHFAEAHGPTPLIASMRCYVASKLGDEVEVPDEIA